MPINGTSIVAKELTVMRGERRIVEKASFSLKSGEALQVTGHNGSGKSTLLRALAGLLPIASGSLTIDAGYSDLPEAAAIHFLSTRNAMKDHLTVGENLAFWRVFCQVDENRGLAPDKALERVDLAHCLDIPFGYLSTGMKRRAALARLLVAEKPIWILDEPTSGLDAVSVKLFTAIVSEFCTLGGILIAATHLPLGLEQPKALQLGNAPGFLPRAEA